MSFNLKPEDSEKLLTLVEGNTTLLSDLTKKVEDIESRTLTTDQLVELAKDMSDKQWRAKTYEYIVEVLKTLLLVSGATAAGVYLYEFIGGIKK